MPGEGERSKWNELEVGVLTRLEAAESELEKAKQRATFYEDEARLQEANRGRAESALTEALDAIGKHQRAIDNGDTASRADDSLWNTGERIRSQIEGSNDG